MEKVPADLAALCNLGARYYNQGWMPATAGNLSLRTEPDSIWITSSGLDKGSLKPSDFIQVDIGTGKVLFQSHPEQKPSAETSIHLAIYKQFPESGAVLHIHNPESLQIQPKLTRENPYARWTVPPIELVKAMGFWEEDPQLYLPVIYNYAKVDEIAAKMEEFFSVPELNQNNIPAILVENHGPSIWGRNLQEANRNLETLEYILKVSKHYVTTCI